MAIVLKLNPRKVGNYAFFCPVTKLHLTLTNPVGTTDRVSPYILRALKGKTLIDVNNVVDLKTGELNVEKKTDKKEENAEPVKSETTVTQDQKEEESSQEVEVTVDKKEDKEEKKTNKRGKRAQASPVDEVAE